VSAWLETYPNDFREPPEYPTLNLLVQFALCNAFDNDLAQKARDQLSAFRECDSSEHISSGLGMCSSFHLCILEQSQMWNCYRLVLNCVGPADIVLWFLCSYSLRIIIFIKQNLGLNVFRLYIWPGAFRTAGIETGL